MLPLFVLMWWEDFQKISRKCVGWEVEGFSFRLNGWQQYYARNYEKKCNFIKLGLGSNWRTLLVQQCGLTKVEPFDIPSQWVWSTWSHKICILVSVKHFSPTNVCVMPFTETDLSQTSNSSRSWTQELVNMAAPCWKLLWGWYVSGFKLMEDQEWAQINMKSTRDV